MLHNLPVMPLSTCNLSMVVNREQVPTGTMNGNNYADAKTTCKTAHFKWQINHRPGWLERSAQEKTGIANMGSSAFDIIFARIKLPGVRSSPSKWFSKGLFTGLGSEGSIRWSCRQWALLASVVLQLEKLCRAGGAWFLAVVVLHTARTVTPYRVVFAFRLGWSTARTAERLRVFVLLERGRILCSPRLYYIHKWRDNYDQEIKGYMSEVLTGKKIGSHTSPVITTCESLHTVLG